MLSFLENIPPSMALGITSGVQLASVTLFLTAWLELLSLDTTRKVLAQNDGTTLYKAAVFSNFFNHYILGVPIYTTSVVLFCSEDQVGAFQQMQSVAACLLIHSVLYYTAHRLMHTPRLYRFHKFHHQFSVNVPPVAANAVTVVEYLAAYVIPFAVASIVISPDELSFRISVMIIAFTNLLIHTPKLEPLSKKLPAIFVSTNDHLEHHRKLNVHFAAPTVNVDWFVQQGNALRVVRTSKKVT